MKNWMNNGVRLAWLIDPHGKEAVVYRITNNPELVSGFDFSLSGENVLPGFHFELKTLE